MNKRKIYNNCKMMFDSVVAAIAFMSFITLLINLLEHNTIYINNCIVCLILAIHYIIKAIYNINKQ